MQNIPFHIAFLLTQHECVIIPGLGAFVVSPADREKTSRWGILSPPEYFLCFNSEIKHTDGLLANSVAKEKKCSYKEANGLIDQYVTTALQSLKEGKRVYIPWVGSLYSKDNKRIFQPERTLSCNAFNYGLTSFSLPHVKEIQQQEYISTGEKNKEIVWIPIHRKIITYTGSIAAALIAMCIIPTPLNNGYIQPVNTQYASLFSLSSQRNIVDEDTNASATIIQTSTEGLVIQPEPVTISEKVMDSTKIHTPCYYIIVASLPNQAAAEKTLVEFRSIGFEDAAILSSDGRHRIYTNRFENKAEAEKFLIQFRTNHPEQANAWLLKLRD
jgi:hypothetical protein